jgi:hypothetical protein
VLFDPGEVENGHAILCLKFVWLEGVGDREWEFVDSPSPCSL